MAGEKLVRIKTEHKLSFKPHTESLCKKASQKLTALSRVASSLRSEQRRILLYAFMVSRLSCAFAVWMFHRKKLNNRINCIHEKIMKIHLQNYLLEITLNSSLPKKTSS